MTIANSVLNALKKMVRAVSPNRPRKPTTLGPQQVRHLVRAIVTTRPDEIGCDECFEELDRFAEMTLAGKSAAEAMPLVQDHLERCDPCREEFEALLDALRVMT